MTEVNNQLRKQDLPMQPTRPERHPMTVFHTGDRIRHDGWGDCTVTVAEPDFDGSIVITDRYGRRCIALPASCTLLPGPAEVIADAWFHEMYPHLDPAGEAPCTLATYTGIARKLLDDGVILPGPAITDGAA